MNANATAMTGAKRATPARQPDPAIVPPVDITEGEAGITLLADMPGVTKDRLSIQVEGESLSIEGVAQVDVPENIELVHGEVPNPRYRRSFTLSRDLDPACIEATLRNGVLHMHVPKASAARPRRIEVQVD
jgi:HSP20 family protein